MTARDFGAAADALFARQPFRPFSIVLADGTRLRVGRPGAIAYRDGRGIHAAPGPVLREFNPGIVSHLHDEVEDRPIDATELLREQVA